MNGLRTSENVYCSKVSRLRDALVALKDPTLGQTHQMPQLLDDLHGDDHCLATLFPERISVDGYETIAERMISERVSNLLVPEGSVSFYPEVTGTSLRCLLVSIGSSLLIHWKASVKFEKRSPAIRSCSSRDCQPSTSNRRSLTRRMS